MITLRGRIGAKWDADRFVVRVTTNRLRPQPVREMEALLVCEPEGTIPSGFKAYLLTSDFAHEYQAADQTHIVLPPSLRYLTEGDIVAIDPRHSEVAVLYRKGSRHNSVLVTERCNNRCVMCSQPPRNADDAFRIGEWLEAIRLMDPSTGALVITGGEPTLLGDDLIRIIRHCKNFLPRTALHVLSNGRFFAYLTYCRALAEVGHGDLMLGIPLYSDLPHQHNFIVQAEEAFDQTIRGMMNLARCRVRVELRVVIHRLNVGRLPAMARFIARNLGFLDHVALMGLELVGFARGNLDALWVDPGEYGRGLGEAVEELDAHRVPVSIYNHPLCLLEPELRPYARQSISDWKNVFLDACAPCSTRAACCGFFASSVIRHSAYVKPSG
jgi:His-Xaa-Ser system radical SAM maturase HxsC